MRLDDKIPFSDVFYNLCNEMKNNAAYVGLK